MKWRMFKCIDCDQDDPFRFIQPVADDASDEAGPDELQVCPRCGNNLGCIVPTQTWAEIVVLSRREGRADVLIEPDDSAA